MGQEWYESGTRRGQEGDKRGMRVEQKKKEEENQKGELKEILLLYI